MFDLDILNCILVVWFKPTVILMCILFFTRWTPARSPCTCSWNLMALATITLFCIPLALLLPGFDLALIPADIFSRMESLSYIPKHFGLSRFELTMYAVFAIYIFVMLILLQEYIIGFIQSLLIVRHSRPVHDAKITLAYFNVRIRLPKAQPEFKVSHQISSPVVWGYWHKIIVLPMDWREWPEGRLERVLTHEVSHIHRGDWLVRQSVFIARAIFWFLPPIWVLSERLLNYAEYACDDAVVISSDCRAEYADDLIHISQKRSMADQTRNGAFVAAVPYAIQHNELAHRLSILLDGARDRSEPSLTYKMAMLATALILIFPLYLVNFASMSEQKFESQHYSHDFSSVAPLQIPTRNTLTRPLEHSNKERPSTSITMSKVSSNKAIFKDNDSKLFHPKINPTKLPESEEFIFSRPKETLPYLKKTISGINDDPQPRCRQRIGNSEFSECLERLVFLSRHSPVENDYHNPEISLPKYPYRALHQGVEGDVSVIFDVGKNGLAENIYIQYERPNNTFRKSVIAAIKSSRFPLENKNGEWGSRRNIVKTYQFRIGRMNRKTF